MYKKFVKRLLDIIFSFIAIILLLPIIIILMLLVKVFLGGPVFFKQERVGLNEKVFKMIKFRTMVNKYDDDGKLLPDEERLTKFGSFLRSTSLDELPELFNILKGDISIVGPRPLLTIYLPYYTEEERKRHNVRGGLTCPEVILGDVNPSWEKQFKAEIDYSENVSFLLDLKIVYYTILIIFKRLKTNYGTVVRKPLNIERSESEVKNND